MTQSECILYTGGPTNEMLNQEDSVTWCNVMTVTSPETGSARQRTCSGQSSPLVFRWLQYSSVRVSAPVVGEGQRAS